MRLYPASSTARVVLLVGAVLSVVRRGRTVARLTGDEECWWISHGVGNAVGVPMTRCANEETVRCTCGVVALTRRENRAKRFDSPWNLECEGDLVGVRRLAMSPLLCTALEQIRSSLH